MQTQQIIAELEAQRDRLETAINALKSSLSNTHHTTKRRQHLSIAAKKRISEKMKERWAARKAAAHKTKAKVAKNGTNVSTVIREILGTGKMSMDQILKRVQPRVNKSAKKITDIVYAMKGSGYLNKTAHGEYSVASVN